jgi:hypothetical protein
MVTSVTLDGKATGGTPPYTYSWTNSDGETIGKTEDTCVDTPDTYTLTVIGNNGCQASASIKVEQDITPPTLEVTESASTLTCSRKEITLKAQVADGCGVYEYSWVNSSGEKLSHTDELTVDKPDQYTITVTGANGCQTSQTIPVDQDISTPDVSIATPETLTCIVTSVTLDGSASGGTAPYTYSWTNSDSQIIATTEDICVDAADTYTLTVTGDNGCCSSASVTVSEDVEAAVVDAGSDQLLTCAVTSVTLDGSASGGTQPYTYQWVDWQGNIIGTTQDIEVSKPGRYTLKVTGANGCQASDCVTVNQDISAPDVSIAPAEKLTCMVTSVTLDGSASGGTQPYKYEWADAGGNIIGITQDIQVSQAGSYTLTVTAGNGCQASASVTVSEDVEAPVVNAGPDRELTCLVSQLTLSADASGGKYPYIFLWRDEYGNILSMEQEWVVNSAGIYRITVVGANGCCGSDEIVVTENTAPPQVSAGPDKVITCSNPEVFIDADISGGQSPYQIEWVNDCGDIVATTEDITVTLPGVYTILVTGNNGCSAFDSVAVSDGIVAPQVDAGPDQLLTCEQEQVMLDATVWGGTSPYTYSWTNACGVVVGTTENLTVSLPSVYTLTVTTADGCVGSDSVRVDKEE